LDGYVELPSDFFKEKERELFAMQHDARLGERETETLATMPSVMRGI
jgi:hypothetical protein